MKACRVAGVKFRSVTGVKLHSDQSYNENPWWFPVPWWLQVPAPVTSAESILGAVAQWLKYRDLDAYNAAWERRAFADIKRRLKEATL